MALQFHHDGPEALRLGIVVAQGVTASAVLPGLEQLIEETLKERAAGLSPAQDEYRKLIRDVFRNGLYKPTGRAKPASEYLLRAASESGFPRINALVDCCNGLSLASLLPISIWDVDLAATTEFIFRLGKDDESYVFNSTGQDISLCDLIVGCASSGNDMDRPIVNAVKDSQATKTTTESNNVAAAIYAPISDGPVMSLEETCDRFATLLAETSSAATSNWGIALPGEMLQL